MHEMAGVFDIATNRQKIIIKQTNGKQIKPPESKKYQDKFGVLLYGYVSF